MFHVHGMAQYRGWDEGCTQDRFREMTLFVQSHGFGIEMGAWPQDARFGYLGGVSFTQVDNVHAGTVEVSAYVYAATLIRVNRYLYFKGMGGIRTYLNGPPEGVKSTVPFVSGGVRLSLPLGRGDLFALILEPQYGTQGFNGLAGLGIAL